MRIVSQRELVNNFDRKTFKDIENHTRFYDAFRSKWMMKIPETTDKLGRYNVINIYDTADTFLFSSYSEVYVER